MASYTDGEPGISCHEHSRHGFALLKGMELDYRAYSYIAIVRFRKK